MSQHGYVARYNEGCRCEDCTWAKAEAARTRKAQDEANVRSSKIAQGLLLLFDNEPWRAEAACRGEDIDQFYGFDGEDWNLTLARQADTEARFCNHCPVRFECREAGRRGREYGLWGGENEADRALVRREPVIYQNRAVQRVRAERRQGANQ